MKAGEIIAGIVGVLVVGAVAVAFGSSAPVRQLEVWPPRGLPIKPTPKPTPAGAPPPKQWREEVGNIIALQPDRVYAATIDVPGLMALGANRERVIQELRKYAQWQAIDVYDKAADVPKSWPGPKPEDDGGRYWAIGIPSVGQTFNRPDMVTIVFSRPQ
jgi:hypothetical protein